MIDGCEWTQLMDMKSHIISITSTNTYEYLDNTELHTCMYV
jgi:hypothetical protein